MGKSSCKQLSFNSLASGVQCMKCQNQVYFCMFQARYINNLSCSLPVGNMLLACYFLLFLDVFGPFFLYSCCLTGCSSENLLRCVVVLQYLFVSVSFGLMHQIQQCVAVIMSELSTLCKFI